MDQNIPVEPTNLMEQDNPVIQNMRDLFNDFKSPYLIDIPSGDEDDIQDVEGNLTDVSKHIDTLYGIIMEVIDNNGNIPTTTDINKKAIYSVFEKKGIFPELRKTPSLKETMKYYTILDLHTYPYSFKKHSNKLAINGVKPVQGEIIPNRE